MTRHFLTRKHVKKNGMLPYSLRAVCQNNFKIAPYFVLCFIEFGPKMNINTKNMKLKMNK